MKHLLYNLYILVVALLISTGCNRNPKNGIRTVTICSTTDLHGAYFDSYYNEEARLCWRMFLLILNNLRKRVSKPVLIDVEIICKVIMRPIIAIILIR